MVCGYDNGGQGKKIEMQQSGTDYDEFLSTLGGDINNTAALQQHYDVC